MKIHYTATIWHGGFYQFFSNALQSLNHEVYFFNEGGSVSQVNLKKILSRIPKFQYAANDKFRESVSRDWLESVEKYKPNLIILEYAPNILPEYLRRARELKIPIFYWMDSPPAGSAAQDILASLKFADKIFSIDRQWMTILYPESDFIHLPLAGDPGTFHPFNLKEQDKKYDLVFVGSFPPQSGDGYLRAEIIASIPDKFSVFAFGNGASYWTKHFPILHKRIRKSGILSNTDINEIYNQSKVVLNIHSTCILLHSLSALMKSHSLELSS